jgi:hypothetical protein
MRKFIFVMLTCLCTASIIVVAGIAVSDTLLQDERSLDPRFPAIHLAMIPYVPGYNPRKGVSNSTCLHCHRSVDLINKSSAALLKNVSPQSCALCHTKAGPAVALYK